RDVENLSRLTSLGDLTFHTVTVAPEGLNGLKLLPNLKDLEIWFVNLTDRDMPLIAQQAQLQRLTIYGCDQVTDEGIGNLRTLKSLRRLHVHGKQISKDAVDELKKSLPDCDVSSD